MLSASGTITTPLAASTTLNRQTWIYEQPRGGSNEPYRLTDFNMYNPNSQCCDGNYRSADLYDSVLAAQQFHSDLYNNLSNSNGQNWYPTNMVSARVITCYACKWGPNIGDMFGGTRVEAIPLCDIKSVAAGTNYLRLGLLIKANNQYHLITSLVTLQRAKELSDGNASLVIPSLQTNTYLASLISRASNVAYDAIPCLVENATITFATNDGSHFRSQINSCSKLYCMPSGQGVFQLNSVTPVVHDPIPYPSDQQEVQYLGTYPNDYVLTRKLIASGQGYSTSNYSIWFRRATSTTFTVIEYRRAGGQTSTSYTATGGGGTSGMYGGLLMSSGSPLVHTQPTWSNTYSSWSINGTTINE